MKELAAAGFDKSNFAQRVKLQSYRMPVRPSSIPSGRLERTSAGKGGFPTAVGCDKSCFCAACHAAFKLHHVGVLDFCASCCAAISCAEGAWGGD